jgi:hypothetical protein
MADLILQVVVGTLAIHCVHLELDPVPLDQFQIACTMFRNAAETSSRAARALVCSHLLYLHLNPHLQRFQPVLQTMLVKAYYARQSFLHDRKVPTASSDDEISIFGGRAAAVVHSPTSTTTPPHITPATTPPEVKLSTPSRSATLMPLPAPPQISHPTPPLGSFSTGLEQELMYAAPDARMSQQGWEGLFREAPGPAWDYPMDMASEGAMDDRWSSFMHGAFRS